MTTRPSGRRSAPSCYDYAGAVLHNALSAELWRRTTIYVARRLASELGLSRSAGAKVLRLEHCKVAEFQRRGLVHFHAVIRADGTDGRPPPVDADFPGPGLSLPHAASRSPTPGTSTRWGSELDVQILSREGPLDSRGFLCCRSTPSKSRPCIPGSSGASSPTRT